MSGVGERLSWCAATRPEPQQIRGRTVAPAIQKAVLWSLVNYSGAEGTSFPKQSTLAAETCLSRQTVNAALLALEENDLIHVEESGDHRRRTYVLNLSPSPTHATSRGPRAEVGVADQHVRDADSLESPSPTRSVRDADSIEEPPKEPPSRTTQEPLPSPTALESAGIVVDPDRKPRPTDALWDAIVAWYGSGPSAVDRGQWNKAVAAIRFAGVEPTEIAPLFDEAMRQWEKPFKPIAVAANLPGLLRLVRQPGSSDPALAELRRRRETG